MKNIILKMVLCLSVALMSYMVSGISESQALNQRKLGKGWTSIKIIPKLNKKQRSLAELIDESSASFDENKIAKINIKPILKPSLTKNMLKFGKRQKPNKNNPIALPLPKGFSFIPLAKPTSLSKIKYKQINKTKNLTSNNRNKKYKKRQKLIWPVDTNAKQHISSRFGIRTHPVTKRRKKHHGLDIASKTGTKVLAADSGRVILATRLSGYGKVIKIRHNNGIQTVYGHLSRIHVRKGQHVVAGQKIGRVGRTGRVTGSHLHFEVRQGKKLTSINPLKKLRVPHKVARNSSVMLSRK